jgi:type III restriction enzyme
VQTAQGTKEKTVNIKSGDDLFVRSNEGAAYSQGYSVTEINAEPDAEFIRFTNGLTLRRGLQVEKSIYDYVVYESEVEREFAKKLDQREDIRLFVKLPNWFKVETPVGTYNPDWAVIKHDDQTIYLVRETKSTKNFLKLRTAEADKVRCGQRHFEALGLPFSVVTTADEV